MSAVLVESGPDKGAPWHFGQPFKEQQALLEGRAWVDLSHLSVIAISGADRLRWLHDLTSQHLEALAPSTWMEALILDPQGHIEYQFLIVDDGTTSFLILDNQYKQPLIDYLTKMKFMLRVEVSDATADFALIRIPGAQTEIGGPFELVKRNNLHARAAELNSVATQAGIWANEALRVAQGRMRIGFETDHKTIPNEVGVLNKSVHMQKGCYRGQETVAKVFNLGQPPRRLVMLHLDGSEVDIPAQGSDVTLDGVKVGFIGTVARHYELGTIALALIKRNTPSDALLSASGIAASQHELASLA